MKREQELGRLTHEALWDMVVIGGGATGLGIAVDAASRGYKVVLLEKFDFAKGTSSRSTKLVHGGVRYLAQGNLKLVMEALLERGILLQNAPHLTRRQAFVVPVYSWWSLFYYGIGLRLYDLLAGKLQIGGVRILSRKRTLEQLPGLNPHQLKGGIEYYDGQFDDARLALALALTASDHGACVLNYMDVESLLHEGGKITGVSCRDMLTGKEYKLVSKSVINATGVFADEVLSKDKRGQPGMLSPSQGVHLVVDASFFPGDAALMIPRTDDGRVLFAVPWQGKVVIGTTDTPVGEVQEEPEAFDEEIDFIMSHFNRYTRGGLTRKDVRSVFAGLRPLVKTGNKSATALMSRDHTIMVSASGLITVIGGKWTTYRKMAKDAVANAAFVGKLTRKDCVTDRLRLRGWAPSEVEVDHLQMYGADAEQIRKMMVDHPEWGERLHGDYSYTRAEVIWAIREEMALQVEDVLARRTRLLFLDAKAAWDAAPVVAVWMAEELGLGEQWVLEQTEKFRDLAFGYMLED
jgi:glycerol-3-phosphate dehydrogenase